MFYNLGPVLYSSLFFVVPCVFVRECACVCACVCVLKNYLSNGQYVRRAYHILTKLN